MKVLVTGASGQLGRTLLASTPPELSIVGLDRPQLDISDHDAVQTTVERETPGLIINCAAYSAVDLAESEKEEARQANVDGPYYLAEAARESGARLFHLSTDFVFDGSATEPYAPDAVPNPLGAYGLSKSEGEQRVREALPDHSLILRTSWLYSEYGGNFVTTMLQLFRERDEISVVSDQVGSPTWARSVADVIFAFVLRPDLVGIYHWTDAGQTSWYEFACAVQEEAFELGLLKKRTDIRPIASSEYPAVAKRPAFSALDRSATSRDLGIEATPWRENLRAMLEVMAR